MASKSVITMAQVLLHTPDSETPRGIGWLSQFGENLRISFEPDYIDDAARPTLSQLYIGANERETQAILRAVDDERLVRIGKLPSFFSNLLPEGRNRERLAEQRQVDVGDELELLAAAGHDLPGAVEVVPAPDVPADVLELHVTKSLEPVEAGTVAAPVEDGFSVDGVQTKFSMVHDGRRYVVRRGTAAGEFLAKLPSTKFPDLVFNEACCMRLAEAVGVGVARFEVKPTSELDVPGHVKDAFGEFLLVHRFDRIRKPLGVTARIHFEELTQAIGLDAQRKYHRMEDAMLALLVILKTSPTSGMDDFDEFFRRWTVNALLGNTDAHSKNWGLIYPDGRHPRLSPAYDLVSVASYFDAVPANELAVNRKMDESLQTWGEDRAEAMAKSAGFLQFNRARRVVRETQRAAAAAWPGLLGEAPARVRETVLRRLSVMTPAQAPQRTKSPRP